MKVYTPQQFKEEYLAPMRKRQIEASAASPLWINSLPWTPLPDPPAPSGINNWPKVPNTFKMSTRQRLDSDWNTIRLISDRPGYSLEIRGQFLNTFADAYGTYSLLYQGTATRDSELERSVSVTHGSSTTNTVGVGFSVTAGVEAEAGIFFAKAKASLSTTLSATFDISWTHYEETTVTDLIRLRPVSHPQISACWWQVWERYDLNIGDMLVNYIHEITPETSHQWILVTPTRLSQIYMSGMENWEEYYGFRLGKYSLNSGVPALIITQYPPPV